MSRKFILAVGVIILQTVLFAFAKLPADVYQAIVIAALVGYMGSNAAQKIVQPKEMMINLPEGMSIQEDEQSIQEYSSSGNCGFRTES